MNNRSYKFRVWDKKKTVMVYNGEVDSYNDGIDSGSTSLKINFDGTLVGYCTYDGGKDGLWEHNVDIKNRFKLMQFTGLLDKNGKEIYEGDIVRVSPDNEKIWDRGIVEYGHYASFVVYLPKIGTGIKSPLLNFCVNTMGIANANVYIEVIGTIYENPELLKGENEKSGNEET